MLCSSCNLTNSYVKRTKRKYAKLGVVEWRSETDSASLLWRKVGNGDKNLLLIHGFGPLPELQWKDIVRELHDDFTIYIPDLIYFGGSTSKYDIYDPRFIARQLNQSLEEEQLDSFSLVGLSYGGLISGIYAHEYPNKVRGLILIDALSKYLTENHTDSLAKIKGYEHAQDFLIPEDGKALKAMLEVSFYKSKKYPAWLLNQPAERLYAEQKEEKKALLNFLKDKEADIRDRDYSYNGKVQIVWGNEDLLIPVSNAYLLHDYYPNSKLTILSEVGHAANMEAPEEVSKIIQEFCSQ